MSDQWAIYVRINTGRQSSDLSLEGQELRCRKAARRLGFRNEPQHIWKDKKDSTPADEPALTLVYKAAENGEIEAIFVSLGLQPDVNTECTKFGAVAVFSSDSKDLNPLETVSFFRRMQKAGMHVHFVENLWEIPIEEDVAIRIRAFLTTEAGERNEPDDPHPTRRGNWTTTATYGYDRTPVTGILTVNGHEARGVQLMFRMAGDGKSSREIAGALNSEGYRTKKDLPWNKRGVSNSLRNQIYTGAQLQEGVFVEGAVPRIIPQELFERVRKTVEERRAADRYRDASFFLSGLVKCGHCEGPLLQLPRVGGHRHYRCGGTGAGCGTPAARADLLERHVWNSLREAILNPEEIMKSIRLVAEQDEQDMGTATGEPEVHRDDAGTSAKWKKTVADYCGRLARNIDALDREGKRAILRELRSSITVSRNGDRLSITVSVEFDAARITDSEG